MVFLASWLLWGLGALALPVLIHLWQRRKVVQIPIGTLRFLKAIAARTRRSSRIENLLLLLLRCLLFSLVILAAARPVFSTKSAHLLGAKVPRTMVFLVDNSTSMSLLVGGQTRLETAKACARSILEELKPGDRVAVLAVSDQIELKIAEPTADHALVRKALEEIQPTAGRSDFAAALREAGKIVARSERGARQIFFFTDDQENAWHPIVANPSTVFDTVWQQAAPQLLVIRPDEQPHPSNACVKSLRFEFPSLAPGATARGTVVVENFSTTEFHDVAKLSIRAKTLAQIPLSVSAGATVEIPFEFQAPYLERSWATGTLALSGDNLPEDDLWYFALPLYKPPRALILEQELPGPEQLRPGFYLRKALAAGEAPIRCMSVGQLEETALEGYSILFLVDPGHLGDRSLFRIERFMEAGGTLVVFPGNQTDNWASLPFLPGTPTGVRELPAGRQPVGLLAPAHPFFANAWDSGLPFPALPQKRLLGWEPKPKSQTLLSIGQGDAMFPFLVTAPYKAGNSVFINASADRSWGDLPLSPAFVPLLHQIARFSSAKALPPLLVGDPLPFPASLPSDATATLLLPDGTQRTVQNSRLLMERIPEPGIYEATAKTEQIAAAANADRLESELRSVDPEALRKLGLLSFAGAEPMRQWLSQNSGQAPLWPLLLLIALGALGLEGLLSNLGAARRSQGGEPSIATGRQNRQRSFLANTGGPVR